MSFVVTAITAGAGALAGAAGVAGLTLATGAIAGGAIGLGLASGLAGAEAAEEAAAIQAVSGREAIGITRESRDIARADIEPFREFGLSELPRIREGREGIEQLTTDPETQRRFITENPFFKALADDAQRRLFQNQAARGKVGSGETAEALQKSILLLGNDLLQQTISNRFQNVQQGLDIARIGTAAATRQAVTTTQAGRDISNITTGIGNVQAAGRVGAANSITGGINTAVSAGIGIGNILKLG